MRWIIKDYIIYWITSLSLLILIADVNPNTHKDLMYIQVLLGLILGILGWGFTELLIMSKKH